MTNLYFSTNNYAAIKGNQEGENFLLAQDLAAKTQQDSLFMTQSPNIGLMDEYGAWDNPSFATTMLNPMFVANQVMNPGINLGNTLGGNAFPPIDSFNFSSPWKDFQSPWGMQDGRGGTGQGKTAEEKLQYAQYDKMKKILNEYKKVATDSEKAYIEEALSKSGKIDEKLQALKDVSKKLNSSVIKESLLSMDPYKAQLIKSGYNVGRNDADAQLLDGIDLAESEIRKSGKVDTLCSNVLSGDDDEKIIKIFSYWNDKFNSKDPKGIIRLIAKHLPSKSGTTTDPYVNQKKAVDHIANSLIAQVNKVKATLDKDANLTLLDNSSKEVADALVTASNNFNKENLDKLAAKVDDLYARLRLIEAEKIRNNIQKDYKFINDITGKTIINDGLIVKETEKDLKSEGISLPTNRDVVPSGNRDERPVSNLDDKPVDEQINGLVNERTISSLQGHRGIYKSHGTGNEPAHYYKKQGEQLVELKDVKSIDTKGVCTLRNGERKKLSEVEKVEVSPTEIETYKSSLEKIKQLKQEGKMDKCSTDLPSWNRAGRTLYWSKGKKADGAHQCFVVLGNELMQINCKYVDKNGKIVMEDGSTKEITQLTEDDCTPVNSSEVLATDEPKETKEKEETKTKTSKTSKDDEVKIDENATAEGSGKTVRERLYGDTTETDYKFIKLKIAQLDNYNAKEVVEFIEGYNDEKSPIISWNDELCAQISSENKFGWQRKDACLRTIARAMLKVMEEVGVPKDSRDYTEMEAYSKVGLGKKTNGESCNAWREVAGGWKSWSFWNSERTGAANHMDDIIERVLEKYREKFPKDATANDTKAE